MEKKELIEEIKKLISSTKDDVVEINPKFLDFFEMEELISVRDKLIIKKNKEEKEKRRKSWKKRSSRRDKRRI